MGSNRRLTLVAQPQDFFRELVTSALDKQKISTQPETEFYLVNLLNQFMLTDRLFAKDSEGNSRKDTLTLMLKEALEEAQPQAQNALFRHIGDVSLYMAGFFQESFNRKLVDVDYYIEMGGSAYHHVATATEEAHLKGLYCELSDRFPTFVDVLADVSDQTAQKSEIDILRHYEIWMKTRSERAAKILQEAGILPNKTIKKDYQ